MGLLALDSHVLSGLRPANAETFTEITAQIRSVRVLSVSNQKTSLSRFPVRKRRLKLLFQPLLREVIKLHIDGVPRFDHSNDFIGNLSAQRLIASHIGVSEIRVSPTILMRHQQ